MRKVILFLPWIFAICWTIIAHHYLFALFTVLGAIYKQFFIQVDELPRSWKGITLISLFSWLLASYTTAIPFLLLGMGLQVAALYVYQHNLLAERTKTRHLKKNYSQQISLLYELRKQRHDLEKHMSAILQADSSDTETDTYKRELTTRFTALDTVLHNESNVIAGSLHAYIQQAEEKGISLDYQLHQSLSGFPLSDYEMITLLGNILENAIDAAAEIPQGKVLFSCRKQSGLFMIVCRNHTLPIDKRVLEQMYTARAQSSKAGSHEGLGTQEIQRIVKRHHGSLDFSFIKDQFTLKIKIPDVRKD